MPSGWMTRPERRVAGALSRLARANPFLPERIDRERDALGDAFESSTSVWSKRPGRENPNVSKLADRAQTLLLGLRERNASRAGGDEIELYVEVLFYWLYDRFEARFDGAIRGKSPGYATFVAEASPFLAPLGEARADEVRAELPHWFAFLYQVRRASHHIFDFIVGRSLPAARLRGAVWQSIFTHDLRRYRRSLFERMPDVATLVSGPSGTGKELVAQAIGLASYVPFDLGRERFELDTRRAFYPLNLSALAPTLLESELFGHRRGAFTGALADRKGYLAGCPRAGAVFLDEIGELDPAIQVKLLRVLQTREFQPLGDTKRQRFDGKVIAATNRDLAAEMQAGRFREDLYYRLCSDLIETPSLREQLEDAPDDLEELVRFIARRVVSSREASEVTEEVLAFIRSRLPRDYPWPGNVRELEQCVRNVVIRESYLPAQPKPSRVSNLIDLSSARMTADALIERYCAALYERTGSYVEAGRMAGLDRRTVKAKVEAAKRRGL